MRHFLMTAALVVMAAGHAAQDDRPNTLTRKESAEGWILLFDGRSLTGWEQHFP